MRVPPQLLCQAGRFPCSPRFRRRSAPRSIWSSRLYYRESRPSRESKLPSLKGFRSCRRGGARGSGATRRRVGGACRRRASETASRARGSPPCRRRSGVGSVPNESAVRARRSSARWPPGSSARGFACPLGELQFQLHEQCLRQIIEVGRFQKEVKCSLFHGGPGYVSVTLAGNHNHG